MGNIKITRTGREFEYGELIIKTKQLMNAVAEGWNTIDRKSSRGKKMKNPILRIENGNIIILVNRPLGPVRKEINEDFK